ncbi:hypothetical protein NAS141_09651 [Sulfitobacter sp. NAS-14.1]|nr:hypothetical protein NAS141_09651 [Sulfitobacter sp. NAS-14.1]
MYPRCATPNRPKLLWLLCTIFGATLLTVFNALRIENTAQDVVAHTGKVFYTAAADQNNGVFLQVVRFTRDVADDFETVGQAHFGNLTHGRVGLLRCGGVNTCTNAALLRAFLQVHGFRTFDFRLARFADQLLDRWHSGFIPV